MGKFQNVNDSLKEQSHLFSLMVHRRFNILKWWIIINTVLIK